MIPSTSAALRSEGHRSIVVIRNYRFDPITVVSCRAKDHPLGPPSNLFRPRRSPPQMKGSGGGAGYRPRVRKTYSDVHLSPYPPCDGPVDISRPTAKGKVFRRPGRGFPTSLSFLRMRVYAVHAFGRCKLDRRQMGRCPQRQDVLRRGSGSSIETRAGWPSGSKRHAVPLSSIWCFFARNVVAAEPSALVCVWQWSFLPR